MTAVTIASARMLAPVSGVKEMIFLTDSAAATGYTLDLTGYFSTIWGCYVNDSTGVVKTATWSTLTLTLGTLSTGVHTIRVWGV
jgi:hypothetical protein